MTDTPGQKPNRLETSALFAEIANQTHLPEETVRLVLDTFSSILKEALMQGDRIIIRQFGTYQAKRSTYGGFEGVHVRFKPAEELKRALKEAMIPMEKYGVELKSEAALLAQVTGECPDCKAKLESTNPPKCPNCGTKPFEAQETK